MTVKLQKETFPYGSLQSYYITIKQCNDWILYLYTHAGWFFNCSSQFSEPNWKMMGGQSDYAPLNSQCTKDPHCIGWTKFFFLAPKYGRNSKKNPPYIYRWMVATEQWVQRDMERAADHGPGATNRGEWFVSMKTLHRWKIGKTSIPTLSAYIKSGLQEFKIISTRI